MQFTPTGFNIGKHTISWEELGSLAAALGKRRVVVEATATKNPDARLLFGGREELEQLAALGRINLEDYMVRELPVPAAAMMGSEKVDVVATDKGILIRAAVDRRSPAAALVGTLNEHGYQLIEREGADLTTAVVPDLVELRLNWQALGVLAGYLDSGGQLRDLVREVLEQLGGQAP